MLEVCFDLSVEGLLKSAKNKFLGNDHGRVLSLAFALSLGNIADFPDFESRKEVFEHLNELSPWRDEERVYLEKNLKKQFKNREDLFQLSKTEPVRLWVDKTADSLCGFLSIAELLYQAGSQVSMVFLPFWEESEGGIVCYKGWGEVESQRLPEYLMQERKLSQTQLQSLSCIWKTLQRENAPLRVFLGGRILGVDDCFYDHFILKRLTKEMHVSELIVSTLVNFDFSIGDGFIAQRIHSLIRDGQIKLIQEDAENFYQMVICKKSI